MWIGTTNSGKLGEFAALLAPLGIPLDILSLDVPETGSTFEENAKIKALAYAKAAMSCGRDRGSVVICEDSGLVVPALNGLPGPWSARFADLDLETKTVQDSKPLSGDLFLLVGGRHETDRRNNERLLEMMSGIAMPFRGAYFAIHITVAKEGKVLCEVKGEAHGWIATEPKGTKGFGYDPIFIGQDTFGKTYAELDPVRKNLRSHRKKAMDQLYMWLSQHFAEVLT